MPRGMDRRAAIERIAASAAGAAWALSALACSRGGDEGGEQVVAYCSVDSDVAQPLFDAFAKAHGVRVDAVYDTEATKTTGLVNRLLGEKSTPRADVWWSSEPFGTIRLAKAGVLKRFESVHERDFARGWPKSLRASDGTWYGFARRTRVLVYNTRFVKAEELPSRLGDLAKARWQARVAIARPQFGTTRGHMAALRHACGERAFEDWIKGLAGNRVRLYEGNSAVVRAVGAAEMFVGLTDNDDVASGKKNGWPVEAVAISNHLLDQTHDRAALDVEPFPERTMQVPCTAALVAGGPNPRSGARLLNFLLSAETDDALTRSVFETHGSRTPSRDVSGMLNRDGLGREWLRPSDLDLEAAAEQVEAAMQLCERWLK